MILDRRSLWRLILVRHLIFEPPRRLDENQRGDDFKDWEKARAGCRHSDTPAAS